MTNDYEYIYLVDCVFQAICCFVAVIQHYLHTSLFAWMLVEGINLYIKIVKVFTVNKQYMTYLAVGWGKFAKCLDWNLMNTHMNFPID